jgi:hypothetical protein
MTATALVTELGTIAERVQDQATNENSPYRGQPILAETAQGKSLAELCGEALQMRRALAATVGTLPDSAFDSQPADDAGNPVWSAGEVITHCNGVLMRFAERAAAMMAIDPPTWSDAQAASGEQRALNRDAAIAAAGIIDLSEWFAAIPQDADLDTATDHPALGKISGRVWLQFMAVHEANHTEQLEELRAARG